MAEEHNKITDQIIGEQLDFFAKNLTGCGFAAIAAKNAAHYEWDHILVEAPEASAIDDAISSAMAADGVSTLSIVFPSVRSDTEFDAFLPTLQSERLVLRETEDTDVNRCYRFRAIIDDEESLVTGFGPFDWLPKTRRAPYTSIVLRVKPRPDYDWHLKPPVPGIIHIADMHMQGMSDSSLRKLWRNSFWTTRGILGKKPDRESAARTTFIVPLTRAQQIST